MIVLVLYCVSNQVILISRPVALEGDVTPDRILDAQLWTDGGESYLPTNTMERTYRGHRGEKNVGPVRFFFRSKFYGPQLLNPQNHEVVVIRLVPHVL